MSNSNLWLRVSRSRRCPVCDHADWCLVSRDGTAAICPRVESSKRIGDSGYLHRLKDDHGDLYGDVLAWSPWAPPLHLARTWHGLPLNASARLILAGCTSLPSPWGCRRLRYVISASAGQRPITRGRFP